MAKPMTADLPRPNLAEKRAAEFYGLLNRTVVDANDVTDFMAWRKEARANGEAYDRLSQTMAAMEGLGDDPALNAIADRVIARAAGRSARRSNRRTMLFWGGGFATAAACLVLTLMAATMSGQTYKTGVGDRTPINLADGSKVILNTDSAVKVRFDKKVRRVELLRGQAFFEVAHDASRPFLVEARDTEVRAVGTRFDVYRRNDDVQVTLTQGRVQVRDETAPGKAWTLSPGQQLLVGKQPRAAAPAPADVEAATSWTAGQVTLRDKSLADGVAEVNRYSRVKIVLGPGVPTERRLGGIFPTGDVHAFAIAAADSLDLDLRQTQGGAVIELSARAPAP